MAIPVANFAGVRAYADILVEVMTVTEIPIGAPKSFIDEVCELVSQIPPGSVATYGQIAFLLGKPRGARQVGWAMQRISDESAPCHRVVNKKGELAPDHVFGREYQKMLLEDEGVRFLSSGLIDMDRHLWKPKMVENTFTS